MTSPVKETPPPANPSAFGVVLTGEEAQVRNVYVASLPAAFTDAELMALFSPFGKIVSCKMFNNDDRPSSQGRAYGFVMFEQPEGADRAIEGLMGAVVGSQRIQVRRAKPPGSRAPPPGYTAQQAHPAHYGAAAVPMAMPPMMPPYGFAPYMVDPNTGMPVPMAMPPQPMMMMPAAVAPNMMMPMHAPWGYPHPGAPMMYQPMMGMAPVAPTAAGADQQLQPPQDRGQQQQQQPVYGQPLY